jgi:beta-N-acetylhexosaminidase
MKSPISIKTLTLIGFLSMLVGVLGYISWAKPFASVPGEVAVTVSPSPSSETTLETDAERRWRQLSNDQKITQLMAVGLTVSPELVESPESASEAGQLAWVALHQPGMVVIFGSQLTSQTTTSITSALKTGTSLPPLVAVDHEGGTVQRLSGAGFTRLPSWQALCALPDETFKEQLTQSAQELKVAGIHIVLAPVVDVATANPILKSRICSGDPALVTSRANMWMVTFWEQGILSVLKHFPGIGQTTKDLHTNFDTVTLQQSEAAIFRSLLEEWPQLGVMTAHVGITNQQSVMPCSLSKDCVGELVRNFPAALVITDALEMNAAGKTAPTLSERSEAALRAGNTLLLFGDGVAAAELDKVRIHLQEIYETDAQFKKQADESGVKILGYKRKLGVTW